VNPCIRCTWGSLAASAAVIAEAFIRAKFFKLASMLLFSKPRRPKKNEEKETSGTLYGCHAFVACMQT
jgi:succinate dehydrogenase/fumarate reductase-like Fe-S protein